MCICEEIHAEYRVYQYLIYPVESPSAGANNKTEPKIVISSLPLNSFANFKNIALEQIFLKRTWTCGGHTGHHLAYCQSPYLAANTDNGEMKTK
ncbi:MAG: hypothetical protein QE271_12205 [Bacteriovoracaceae bacterium]|nr:hypothetical protein [Bacteriovoracaceae bacterium]